MWDVLGELRRVVREALEDWPGTLRLLRVLAAVTMAVVILQWQLHPQVTIRYQGQDAVNARADSCFSSDGVFSHRTGRGAIGRI